MVAFRVFPAEILGIRWYLIAAGYQLTVFCSYMWKLSDDGIKWEHVLIDSTLAYQALKYSLKCVPAGIYYWINCLGLPWKTWLYIFWWLSSPLANSTFSRQWSHFRMAAVYYCTAVYGCSLLSHCKHFTWWTTNKFKFTLSIVVAKSP